MALCLLCLLEIWATLWDTIETHNGAQTLGEAKPTSHSARRKLVLQETRTEKIPRLRNARVHS